MPIRSSSWRNIALGVSLSRTRVNESAINGCSTRWTATVMGPSVSDSAEADALLRLRQCIARLDDAVDDAQPLRERRECALHRVDRQPFEVIETPAERVVQLLHLVRHRRRAHETIIGVDRHTES